MRDNEDLFTFPSTIATISCRNSGKTFFWETYLQKNADIFDAIYIMSKTAKMTGAYKDVRHPHLYIGEYNGKMLRDVVLANKNNVTTWGHNSAPQILFLLDDVVSTLTSSYKGEDDVRELDWISNLFTESRHYNISIIQCLQIANRVFTTVERNNSDFILASRLNTDQIRTLSEGTKIPHSQLVKMLDTISQYEFLMIDNLNQSDEVLILKAEKEKKIFPAMKEEVQQQKDEFAPLFGGISRPYSGLLGLGVM